MPRNGAHRQLAQQEEVMEYTNSQIEHVIDEHIHVQRDRNLLKRRYIDGITFEKLGEEFGLSDRQVKNIVYKYEAVIFRHCQEERKW